MLIWNEAKGREPGLPFAAMSRAGMMDAREGFFAATRLATSHGWRRADALKPGDMVLTHDAEMQPIVRLGQSEIGAELSAADPSEWPLFVPSGSIGNSSDLIVMPGQWLLIESRLAERLLGTAQVMIRAADMDSARGLFRVAPSDRATVVRLEFENDQVIIGAGGALLACQGRDGLLAARARGLYHSYRKLTPAEADVILSQDILPAAREAEPLLA